MNPFVARSVPHGAQVYVILGVLLDLTLVGVFALLGAGPS